MPACIHTYTHTYPHAHTYMHVLASAESRGNTPRTGSQPSVHVATYYIRETRTPFLNTRGVRCQYHKTNGIHCRNTVVSIVWEMPSHKEMFTDENMKQSIDANIVLHSALQGRMVYPPRLYPNFLGQTKTHAVSSASYIVTRGLSPFAFHRHFTISIWKPLHLIKVW